MGDATRYYIYRSDTEFETFVQVGETSDSSTTYTMKVGSGADYYYKVAAVDPAGKLSPFSIIQRGTSLAEPLVSGIEGVAGKEDSDVIVYWYMGNVDAYQQQVRYNVVCYDAKGTEVARVPVDGSRQSKTEAIIPGLHPNSDYKYKVEAYLVSAQDRVEASQPIDAATARRLRPSAPEELRVEQGLSTQEIVLSFRLPQLVDVALPGGLYDQKPLYFKIYRRERREGAADTEEGWQLLKPDFGKTATVPAENETQKVDFGSGDEEYTPGKLVAWTDTTALRRGVQYEYKVQSFSYTSEREITSNYSHSIQTGWLLAPATFSIGTYTAVKNAEGTANVSASLDFKLDWDDMGLASQYHFILKEARAPLEKDGGGAASSPAELKEFDTKDELLAYIRHFEDLSNQENRGYYHYSLSLCIDGKPDPIETLESLGRAIVTDSVNLPVIPIFSTTVGYQNKVELSWEYKDTERYRLAYSDGSGAISYIEHDQLAAGAPASPGTHTYTHSIGEGKEFSYILSVTNDEGTVDSPALVGSTSRAPNPKARSLAYDSIEVEWDDVPAQEFTVSARYNDPSLAQSHAIDSQTIPGSADGLSPQPKRAAFNRPSGYDDARVSGKPLTVTVAATIPVKKSILELRETDGSSYGERIEEVSTQTLSKSVTTCTMGPALVKVQTSVGAYSDKITLTWNKVEGAAAYAILRTSLHISEKSSGDSLLTEFQNTDKFIVTDVDSTTPSITLNPAPSDVDFVKKHLSVTKTDTGFTLTDTLCTEESEDVTLGKWLRSQSQLSWGAPYDYIVLPLLSAQDAITYDYETNPTVVTVDTVSLTSVQGEDGATKGYAWNIKATKGTYSENGENTGVKLTWTRPWAMPTVAYSVYRADSRSNSWTKLNDVVDKDSTEYVDESANPGTMYQYMVAPSVDIENEYPYNNEAYIRYFDTIQDQDFDGERLANGFTLPQIPLTSASRENIDYSNEHGGKIELTWGAPTTSGKTNYLFDGFVVEVLNNNLDDQWHEVATLAFDGDIQAAPTYSPNVDNSNGMLKVLRDYKLYFRVRTYTYDDNGDKVFSKAPDYAWSDGKEDTYVKWGARQLTPDELIKAATLVMSIGIEKAVSQRSSLSATDKWSAAHGLGRYDVSQNPVNAVTMNALGGTFSQVHHVMKFHHFRPPLTTKSGKQVTAFVSINAETDATALRGYTGGNFAIHAPTKYHTFGSNRDSGTPNWITVTGPVDVNGMYSAELAFNALDKNNGGWIRIRYPTNEAAIDGRGSTAEGAWYTRNGGTTLTPLAFSNDSTFRNNNEEWK